MLLFVLLVVITGCAKQADKPDGQSQQRTAETIGETAADSSAPEGFERKIHRTFSILMPAKWSEIEYANMIFYLPPGSEAVDPISEKVEVIAVALPKDNKVPLKEILESGIEESKKLVPDLSLVKEEEIKAGNAYAVKMVFTGTIQGKKFENVQISTINQDMMIHIVHNCYEENCQYSDIYNKMAKSIELLPYEQTGG